MPAMQQSSVPSYKETANIPRPNTTYDGMIDGRDTPGYSLARLLGALPGAAQKHKQIQEEGPSEEEQAQLAALAQMGAERDRLKIAKGQSFFGLLRDQETTMDSYNVERGRRDADLFAGELRDAYAEAGLAETDDPAAFAAFAEQYRDLLFNEKLKDADTAYYHGFVTRVGPIFEEMANAHAGHLDSFVSSKNKRAFQERLNSKIDLDMTVRRERDAFGTFMDSIMGAESGGNYNAFHGNGNNQSIRFTDMTIGDVLQWQKNGLWKRHGASSSAVGKYQFLEKTLRETAREAGVSLDTKFTPAVQDKLIFHRLTQKRGMKDYLEGKISAEEFLDSGLAKEFAGLKMTSGKGAYDEDGLNKATLSSRKTLAALKAFKEAYLQDPARASKTNEEGKIVIDAEDQRPDNSLAGMVDNVEAEYGIPQTEARAEVANSLITRMENNPQFAERDDIEDLMADAKLPKKERERVRQVRDRVRKESAQKAHLADNKQAKELMKLSDRYIRDGDPEALEEIKAANPKIYSRLLDLTTEPADPDGLDNEGFLAAADYSDDTFPQRALKAYADGSIDRDTYSSAMEEYEIREMARPVLRLSGVKKTVDMLKYSLPGEDLKDTFDAQLALQIADLTRANDGNRPPIAEVTAAAQAIHQSLIALRQGDVQQRMSRPEYNAES